MRYCRRCGTPREWHKDGCPLRAMNDDERAERDLPLKEDPRVRRFVVDRSFLDQDKVRDHHTYIGGAR